MNVTRISGAADTRASYMSFPVDKNSLCDLLPQELSYTVGTFSRIQNLYQVFPSDSVEKEKAIATLNIIWNRALKVGWEDRIEERIKKLDQRNGLIKFYGSRIKVLKDNKENNELFKKYVNKYQKDLFCLADSPSRCSNVGGFGPTLLLRYNRPEAGSEAGSTRLGVIKWTTQDEVFSSAWMRVSLKESGVKVPRFSCHDLDGDTLIRSNGEVTAFLAEDRSYLQEHLTAIKSVMSPEKPLGGKIVMFSERVIGANLLDFASAGWMTLSSSSKQQVFKQLGCITLADLLLGNTDRLIRFRDGHLIWRGGVESNLGNIMVTQPRRKEISPVVYAIDNGVCPEFFKGSSASSNAKKAYQDCLRAVFSNPNALEVLAAQALQSMRVSFYRIEDREGNEELVRKLATFFEDLTLPESKQSFISGLQEQKERFQTGISYESIGAYQAMNPTVSQEILVFFQENREIILQNSTEE